MEMSGIQIDDASFKKPGLPVSAEMNNSSETFLSIEDEIKSLIEEMRNSVNEFIRTLEKIDEEKNIRRSIYNVLYRLYGISIAEVENPDVAFGHVALAILLSTVFYEHVRDVHQHLKPVMSYVSKLGPVEGLASALDALHSVDYDIAIGTTLEILRYMPVEASHVINRLIALGVKISSNKELLKRDFAGRIYHTITGDMATRKGLATFYTEVPASHLLASLAIGVLLDVDEGNLHSIGEVKARRLVERIRGLKIADFACGSGTLLTASYYSIMRLLMELKHYYNLNDICLNEEGRMLIEKGIFGIDAMRYATQITAINLALMAPSIISNENIYTIYLGYIPENNQAWLGSLELLNEKDRVNGTPSKTREGLKGIADRTSIIGSDGVVQIPGVFDMVIMNPPFTRFTGRVGMSNGDNTSVKGFFGLIVDKNAWRMLQKSYDNIRRRVNNDLVMIARSLSHNLPKGIRDIIQGESELKQYLSIGLAGEGILFLYLAYKYVREDGVIAFILPRNVLAGVSWFLARTLLASKFHVKYVVISSDPVKGYSFSEGSGLSEALIVAKRVEMHSDGEETVFVNLLSKPSTVLEVAKLVEEINKKSLYDGINIVEAGSAKAIVFKILRRQLLENLDNWNRFVSIPDPEMLTRIPFATRLSESTRIVGAIELDGFRIEVPIVKFGDIMFSIGDKTHHFSKFYNIVNYSTPYPIVYGGREKIRERMIVSPNAYAYPKNDRYGVYFMKYYGRVLIPYNFDWTRAHVTALYSTEPVMSNVFFIVRLRVNDEVRELAEKSIVLWLNTTWGLLSMLVNRLETSGPWSKFVLAQWKLMPVLDVTSIERKTLERLARVFDKYASRSPKRIPNQFNPDNPDTVRLGIDVDFLKALDPNIDDRFVKDELCELYGKIYTTLNQWLK
jgi:hypothetical protein